MQRILMICFCRIVFVLGIIVVALEINKGNAWSLLWLPGVVYSFLIEILWQEYGKGDSNGN